MLVRFGSASIIQPLRMPVKQSGKQQFENDSAVRNHLPLFTGVKRTRKNPIDVSLVNMDNLKAHVAYLASDECAGRHHGTKGIANSRRYIEKHFKKYGLKPFTQLTNRPSLINPITGKPTIDRNKKTGVFQRSSFLTRFNPGTYLPYRMTALFRTGFTETVFRNGIPVPADDPVQADRDVFKVNNLMGYIPGKNSDEYIIVMAHGDHLGRDIDSGKIFRGAEDNATGVGALLEVARVLSKTQPKKNILFVVTEGEEKGTLGASVLGKRLEKAGLASKVQCINIDSIGASGSKLTVEGSGGIFGNRALADTAIKAAQRQGVPHEDSPRNDRTDAHALEKRGIRAITLLWDFPANHDYDYANRPGYHKTSDTPEAVVYENVETASRVALETVFNLANQ